MGAASLLSKLSSAFGGARPAAAVAEPHPGIELPDRDQVLYVVGDVHGCLLQLVELERKIEERARRFPDREHIVVYVGDLIDRGPRSADVIDHVMAPACGSFRRIALLGNHEEAMLEARHDSTAAADWIGFGGFETLKSYGATDMPRLASRSDFRQLQRMIDFLVPEEHWEWLGALPRSLRWRGYFVAHAGIRPGCDLAEQSLRDLIWIREPFLSSREDFGAVVVHGHTPQAAPERYPNRIGVDTGCFMTGCLSAAMLDRDTVHFLTVS